jgi:hypothetical protein
MDDIRAWMMLALLGAVVLGAALAVAAALPAGRRPAAAALVPALGLIAILTLTPTGYGHASVNLDLGAGLAAPWRSSVSAVNILGNLLLFVPAGVVLPAALPWLRHLVPLTLTAAAGSVLVELTQYGFVPGRAADVNDIALNTAGAIAGLLAFRLVAAAQPARQAATSAATRG